MNTYIRSSKTSLKFTNKEKLKKLLSIQIEYTRVLNLFIQFLWLQKNNKKFIEKEITDQITTWLSARLKQCCAKQASAIVKGTKAKQVKRFYMYSKLNEEKKYKQARKLKEIIDKINISIPIVENLIPMELDSRFVKIELDKVNSFDGWITLTCLGNSIKLVLPFKRTKHFNKLYKQGILKTGIRLSNNSIYFNFEICKKDYAENTNSTILGIDIGVKNVVSCSNGYQSIGIDSVMQKLSRKKKGSIAYNLSILERANIINRAINLIELSDVKIVQRENIKYLRNKIRTSNFMNRFVYAEIFAKLDRYCEEQNVSVTKISPTYTSQRCSCCGYTRKANRKGKVFKCLSCGYTQDADLNASLNISLNLRAIGKKERLLHINRKGFYWYEEGQEPIVPVVKKDKI